MNEMGCQKRILIIKKKKMRKSGANSACSIGVYMLSTTVPGVRRLAGCLRSHSGPHVKHWCRANHVHVATDMHLCVGGRVGGGV